MEHIADASRNGSLDPVARAINHAPSIFITAAFAISIASLSYGRSPRTIVPMLI
ncbi:hypothetical protein [Aurantiacibacter gangjinensis]|uniref:hypothetical protein n=1 Tax=Aurantiacibacter gangjinensis TaxID=502682 RepID=UPI00090A3FC1|nr:hypothetical protein [Aurantiacibacter gangjinensis]APE27417.1 hypothetical protein BMF35_a0588 [Aurantiacibacter gangjinensis]